MQYNKINKENLTAFEQIVGPQYVISNIDLLDDYSHDYTEDLKFFPEVVVKPLNTNEVSRILIYCNSNLIPVTVRGAGTGLSGGALPIMGGVCLAMERMNKILDIDIENFQATVEPGVINEVIQNAVQEKGLFYPPDPASKGSCFIGGNVAHASGGPRAVKYGTTRDYILNLEVVLPCGEIIWTGANTLKYSTGYNLTHLIIGSEGTLAVITKIVLKLIPAVKHTMLMLASFASPEKACEAINKIFLSGGNPSVCEFVEPDGFKISAKYLNSDFIVPDSVGAYILLEVDGNDTDLMMKECEQISETLYANESTDILFADAHEQKEFLWKLRRTIGEAIKTKNVYKEEDTVVPRGKLPLLYRGVKEISARYGFRSVCYGHTGDGNLHVNILKDDMSEEKWNGSINDGIVEIFKLCKELGGTISGEHGIGLVQKKFMPIIFPEFQLELMRKIKQVFDPNNILNPGKIF